MARKRLNLSGKKFGQLTLLEYVRPGGKSGSIWMAQCDCGIVQEVYGKEVAGGRVVQCRSCRKGLGIQGNGGVITNPIPKGMRRDFSELVKYCSKKRLRVEITPEEYTETMKKLGKECALCGRRHGRPNLLDLTVGLISRNVIILCEECITMRGKRNVAELLGYILRVAAHLKSLQ